MKIEVGFLGLLTLIFVIFKLLGYISWSWWLVLLPAIIGFSIGIIVLSIIVILFVIAILLD